MTQEAKDPIPLGMLSLEEAFDRLLLQAIQNPSVAFPFDEDESALLDAALKVELDNTDPDAIDDELIAYLRRSKEVNLFIRKQLNAGAIPAWVNNPNTGQQLRLLAEGWTGDWEVSGYVPSGIWGSHIDNDQHDLPGPEGTVVAGKSRPVLIEEKKFEDCLIAIFKATKASRGRPKGSGSYRDADAPLIREMKELLRKKRATSDAGAAKMVVSRAAGLNSQESSKIKRLVRRLKGD